MSILTIFLWLASGVMGLPQEGMQNSSADTARLSSMILHSQEIIFDDPDSANYIAMEVLSESEELKYPRISVRALGVMAYVSHLKGNFNDALHHDLLALEIAISYGDSSLLYKTYNNVGDDHIEVRNYNKAHENFIKAFSIAEALDDTLGMAVGTFNMGLVLKELDQYDEALDNFEKALALSTSVNDYEGISYASMEMGHVKFQTYGFSEAERLYATALSNVDTLNFPDLKAEILEKLALNHIHLENYSRAEETFLQALDLSRQLNNRELEAKVLNGLGMMEWYIGNLNQAEQYIMQSLDKSVGSKKKEIEYESYRILSEVEKTRKNFEKSLLYFNKYHHLKDSVMEEEKKVQINNLQLQYDLEMKDLEISSLNNREVMRMEQLDDQMAFKNVLIVLSVVLLLLLALVYSSGRKRRKMNQLLIEHRDEVEKQKDELAELNKVKDKFFSILAHDLRSPIKSLSGVLMLLENNNLSTEETKELIGAIGRRTEQTQRLLDNLLEWALIQMDKITVTKTEFVLYDVVSKNVELIRETSDKDVKINNNVNGVKVYADQNMVDLVLRNLLSNAIKYSGEHPEVSISTENSPTDITVRVRDNGIGISTDYQRYILEDSPMANNDEGPSSKGTGFGLKISKEFIERNGGSLSIESSPGKGSIFSFSIPLPETNV